MGAGEEDRTTILTVSDSVPTTSREITAISDSYSILRVPISGEMKIPSTNIKEFSPEVVTRFHLIEIVIDLLGRM